MAIVPFEHAIPADMQPANETLELGGSLEDAKVAGYVISWRNQIRGAFIQRRNIWDECWRLYRGQDDWDNREAWQSKIVLPKAWASVKQATNTIKRLLAASKTPWQLESVNPEDMVNVLRASQMTDLTRVFLDKADFLKEFSDGLEVGFILGLGLWKVWWGMVPRTRTRVETQMVPGPMGMGAMGGGLDLGLLNPSPNPTQVPPPFNQPWVGYAGQNAQQYPNQLGGEMLNPGGWGQGPGGMGMPPQGQIMVPQRQMVQEEIQEGQLFIRAVDPYNFYWLPGSKLNRWVGTIEEIEVPRWELLRMVEAGIFPREKVDLIQPMRIDERYKMSNMRFAETPRTQNGPNNETSVVKLTEYYGPIVMDGKIVNENAHVILANDSVVLVNHDNPFLHRKPPYVGFSPLSLPFRTEGVGLIENVRAIDKALSQLANLSMDTLLFRLLPIFEVTVEAFENPEELETGLTPGKMLRKNIGHSQVEGIRPIAFEDISQGAVQVAAQLDRAHHEGALISDIAEGLPRWRGQQTATETQQIAQQSESFMGNMASDIESGAIVPLVEMASDLIFQFIDTVNDPRVASILGVGADYLRGMTKEELMEMIQGDYKVKATGITSQLQKAEMLQNLVQFMNLLGQNPEAWMPYVNQDALLRRILEAFRPAIHDIENIVADPETAQAKMAASQQQQMAPDMVGMVPQLVQMAQQSKQAEMDQAMQLQKMASDQQMQQLQMAQQQQQMQAQAQQAQMQMQMQAQELQMRKMEMEAAEKQASAELKTAQAQATKKGESK